MAWVLTRWQGPTHQNNPNLNSVTSIVQSDNTNSFTYGVQLSDTQVYYGLNTTKHSIKKSRLQSLHRVEWQVTKTENT